MPELLIDYCQNNDSDSDDIDALEQELDDWKEEFDDLQEEVEG